MSVFYSGAYIEANFVAKTKDFSMKKQWAVVTTLLLLAAPFVMLGCGGDDDPTDPPEEACSITVTTPVAGDGFVPGDPDNQTVRIRWDKTGSASQVSIELLKAGTLVDIIASSAANSGLYVWTASNMGAPNGTDFTIQVTALNEDNCFGVSSPFSLTNIIGCDVTITNVFEQGATLVAGNALTLTWDSASTMGNVSFELWREDNDAGAVGFINEAPLDDTGSWDWTIDSLNSGTYDYYYLKIIANGVEECVGTSDTFAMVDVNICTIEMISPQPDDVWTEGQPHIIDIVASNDVTAVNFRLYKGQEFLGNITFAPVLVTDIPYVWESVDDFGNETGNTLYRIRAVNVDDQYCVGESEPFTIISTQ